MVLSPERRYVEASGARLGLWAWGSGELPLVFVNDPPTHLDLVLAERSYVDQLRRLGRFARVLSYDRRGMGTSDPLEAVPTLEREVADLEVVMDAAGLERATICGYGISGTPIAALFAATRPHRVDRLVLLGPLARGYDNPPWPPPITEEMMARLRDDLEDALAHWGEGRMLAVVAPVFDTPRNRQLFAMLERSSCSRAVARALTRIAAESDLTDVFASLRVPTLALIPPTSLDPTILEYAGGLISGAEIRHIAAAPRSSEIGDYWGPVFEAIELFMTGQRAAVSPTRTYAAVLFTDIVSSTEHAARMGDAAWRSTLLRHDGLLRDEVETAGGRVAHPTGDGALSVFDGPEQAVRCAKRIIEKVPALGIQVRAGVHVGDCEQVGQDLAGVTVHIGARVAARADADEILITEPTCALLAGSDFHFSARGEHELKGVPGKWRLSAVTPVAPHQLEANDTTRDLRAGDRAVLLAARRAPRLLQFLSSISLRGQRRTSS